MVSSSQIREKIVGYLDREIDLNALHYWLVQNSANVDFGGSASAENLIFAVEGMVSEYSHKDIGASELRRELNELVHRDNIHVVHRDAVLDGKPRVEWLTSSAAQVVFAQP